MTTDLRRGTFRRRRRRPAAGACLVAIILLVVAAGPLRAQDLQDLVRQSQGSGVDTTEVPTVPPPPPGVVAAEVILGTALAAGAGYGVGLLLEGACSGCDAGDPGGGGPGLALGVPAGALLGVWIAGRLAPPEGNFVETLMGALAGAAVFAGYATLLEEEADLVRWAGVVAPPAMAAMAFNRSRRDAFIPAGEPVGDRRDRAPRRPVEVALLRIRF